MPLSSSILIMETWLDLLPHNVCEDIASFISRRNTSWNALHLAEVSDTQARAVAVSLSNSLLSWNCNHSMNLTYPIVPACESEQLENEDERLRENNRLRWLKVMRPYVRQVSSEFPELLEDPNLQKVVLCDFDRSRTSQMLQKLYRMGANSQVPRLTHLAITITVNMDMDFLFQILSRFRLTHLELYHAVDYTVHPSIRKRRQNRSKRPRLQFTNGRETPFADCCPLVKSLKLDSYVVSSDLYRELPHFPCLEELELVGHKVPKEEPVLRWMQTLKSVKMTNMIDGMQVVKRVKSAVRGFSSSNDLSNFASEEDFITLSEASLETLNMRASKALEENLLGKLGAFSKLVSLSLHWPYWEVVGDPIGFYTQDLSSVQPGFLVRIVQGLPLLREVKYIGVRIELVEIEMILQHMGRRLEVFGTSVYGQSEMVVARYEAMVRLLAVHNPCLRELDIGGWISGAVKSESLRQRLRMLNEYLSYRATGLDVDHLHRAVGAWKRMTLRP